MDQTSLRCAAHELTEVMRGKKNKGALGVETKKGKDEHLYRFVLYVLKRIQSPTNFLELQSASPLKKSILA